VSRGFFDEVDKTACGGTYGNLGLENSIKNCCQIIYEDIFLLFYKSFFFMYQNIQSNWSLLGGASFFLCTGGGYYFIQRC
jgi:hypothetical protein